MEIVYLIFCLALIMMKQVENMVLFEVFMAIRQKFVLRYRHILTGDLINFKNLGGVFIEYNVCFLLGIFLKTQ